MLARQNRVTAPEDFRAVMRKGKRVPSSSMVVYALKRNDGEPARFGFIVAKTVSKNAVARNRVKRILREVAQQAVRNGATNVDVVVRALPSAAAVLNEVLVDEVTVSLHRARV